MKKYCLILLLLLLCNCATIINGTSQKVNISTGDGKKATATIHTENGVIDYEIPNVVNVKRSKQDMNIVVKEDKCTKTSQYVSTSKIEPVGLVLDIITSWPSTTTDYMNGSMWEYDNTIVVPVNRKNNCSIN